MAETLLWLYTLQITSSNANPRGDDMKWLAVVL